MSFYDFLQNTAREIDEELDVFFHNWSKDVRQISHRLSPLIDALADACRGGKRIRGGLVMLGYEMSNDKCQMTNGRNEILQIAVAYEIFQTAILAHDDIIDNSSLRRGKPSLHARLGEDSTGRSLAICLGDIGFFLAFRLIAESEFGEKEKNRALAIFSDTMLETGLGELLDVELSRPRPPKVDCGEAKDIITVYKLKTAYYTITAPLLLGGILGGLTDGSLSAIKIFGQNLGIAFQIQDDINDIFSDRKRLGKELGGDIREGKNTSLYFYAKEHADRRQGKILEKYYGNTNIGQREIEAVKVVLVETGTLEYASSEIKKYCQTARESIAGITKSKKYAEMFLEMTEYFIKIKD